MTQPSQHQAYSILPEYIEHRIRLAHKRATSMNEALMVIGRSQW